eukprot:scaffold2952_cov312-Pinguiococcus_pyrenoidosus.AAC.18
MPELDVASSTLAYIFACPCDAFRDTSRDMSMSGCLLPGATHLGRQLVAEGLDVVGQSQVPFWSQDVREGRALDSPGREASVVHIGGQVLPERFLVHGVEGQARLGMRDKVAVTFVPNFHRRHDIPTEEVSGGHGRYLSHAPLRIVDRQVRSEDERHRKAIAPLRCRREFLVHPHVVSSDVLGAQALFHLMRLDVAGLELEAALVRGIAAEPQHYWRSGGGLRSWSPGGVWSLPSIHERGKAKWMTELIRIEVARRSDQ